MRAKANLTKIAARDQCQTPPYALDPLLPYLRDFRVIWEPAAGEGLLVRALREEGFVVVASDILTGEDFFEWCPTHFDVIVTNPPYSVKYRWLERCYSLGKPFALLLPVETLGAGRAQALFKQYGMRLLVLNKRVNFKMPRKGWAGGGGITVPCGVVYLAVAIGGRDRLWDNSPSSC